MNWNYKKLGRISILALVIFYACSDTSFAFGGFLGNSDTVLSFAKGDETLQSFARFFAEIIKLVTFVAIWILSSVGDLIGTDLVTGPEAMNVLLPMWRYVRDLTNIGFVLLLVGLAFTNLYASFSEGGNWTIKEKLPKIIIAIVAVNFSSLFFRIAIDAVNFGSVALFSIADSQLEANNATSVEKILTGKNWSLIKKPDNITKPFTTNKVFDENGKVSDKTKDGSKREPIKVKRYVNAEVDTPAIIGQSCDEVIKAKERYVGQTFYTENFVNSDKHKDSIAICGSFAESINSLFCSEGGISSDACFFQINTSKLGEKTGLSPESHTAQNLFMSFGTQFVRLEKLPVLAANATSLYGVLDSTLFALILSIAYVIALIAFFIALLARIFVLWISIICSPAIVAASIVGITDKSKEGIDMFVTHLILPLKVALAFSVSFVMLNGMTTFKPQSMNTGFIDFGPQLSHLAMDKYGLVWQVATIFAFWKIAKWATDGTISSKITDKVFDWSETIGGYLAKSATIENQIIPIPTKDGTGVSIADLAAAPLRSIRRHQTEREARRNAFVDMIVGSDTADHKKLVKEFQDKISYNKSPQAHAKAISEIWPKLEAERITDRTLRKKLFEEELFKGKSKEERRAIINQISDNDKLKNSLLKVSDNLESQAEAKKLAKLAKQKDGTTADTTKKDDNNKEKQTGSPGVSQTTSSSNNGTTTFTLDNRTKYTINTDKSDTNKEALDKMITKMANDPDKINPDKKFTEDLIEIYKSVKGITKSSESEVLDEMFSVASGPQPEGYKKENYENIKTKLKNTLKTNDQTKN